MNKIKSREISVVVQGPVHHQDNLTKRVLESIRTHLPDAEVVLSTWKGQDISELRFDVLVENEDPGEIPHKWGSKNLHRQLLSTFSGIRATSRIYVMKNRTDVLLESSDFLRFYQEYGEKLSGEFSVFKQRVFISSSFTFNPTNRQGWHLTFHPSDIWQFGLREDLLELWSAPPPKLEMIPVASEQYYFIHLLIKKGYPLCLKDGVLVNPRQAVLSEKILMKNFVVLDNNQIRISLPEKLQRLAEERQSVLYSFCDWRKINFCGGLKGMARSIHVYLKAMLRKYRRNVQGKHSY